jgi:RNA methyltransferase, TrmH family
VARRPAARPSERPAARHQSKAEEKYHGVRACEALFARRPGDIIRVYVAEDRRRHFAAILEHCAKARLGFQVVAHENLARISESTHHEGIVILARACPRWGMPELLRAIEERRLKGPLLYLDGVQNPHNLGAILRTAAHFGTAAVLGARGDLPPLSPAAVRVAEGAAEHVPVCDLADPQADLKRLKELGFRVVATSSHRGSPVSPKSLGGKIVLVLGSEGEGVSKPIAALADESVQIPGTGAVESLNVSVACGILLAEAWRSGGF